MGLLSFLSGKRLFETVFLRGGIKIASKPPANAPVSEEIAVVGFSHRFVLIWPVIFMRFSYGENKGSPYGTS